MNGTNEQEILCKTLAQKTGGQIRWEGNICVVESNKGIFKIGKNLTVDFKVNDPGMVTDAVKLIKEAYEEIRKR